MLRRRIDGRYVMTDILGDSGEVIVEKDAMISPEQAKAIADAGIRKVKIRSILNCKYRKTFAERSLDRQFDCSTRRVCNKTFHTAKLRYLRH